MLASVRHRSELPALDVVLRDLYGALAEEATFNRCMRIAAAPLRSHLCGVHHEDSVANFSRVDVTGTASAEDMAALSREYSQRWVGQNEWLRKGMERILTYGYGDGDDAVTEAELFAMPYYQHYLRRVDVRHGLGLCVWQGGPGQVTVASFNRSSAEGPYGAEALRFIAALRPHLYNVYAIYRRAALLTDTNRSLRATLDHAPIGALVVDAVGQILEANSEAERRLAANHGLRRGAGGRLQVKNFAQHKQLQSALTELIAGVVQNRVLLVARPGRAPAESLVLHLCALPDPGRVALSTRVIVFLCPLSEDCARRVAGLILQTALSLTAAESRVVLALHASHDLADAAAMLGVGMATVRTHLLHAFKKAGVRRQAELMALVERLLIVAPRDTIAANAPHGELSERDI